MSTLWLYGNNDNGILYKLTEIKVQNKSVQKINHSL